MGMIDELAGKALSGRLPEFNPKYCYVLNWMFEEDNVSVPHEETFTIPSEALNAMVRIVNTPKTLVHISLSRRNA